MGALVLDHGRQDLPVILRVALHVLLVTPSCQVVQWLVLVPLKEPALLSPRLGASSKDLVRVVLGVRDPGLRVQVAVTFGCYSNQ